MNNVMKSVFSIELRATAPKHTTSILFTQF
jgi:hypothetical protein